jgi:hypothetical protein
LAISGKEIFSEVIKKLRGTRIRRGYMTFSGKLSRVSNGFGILMWQVISSAHNLKTIVNYNHTEIIPISTEKFNSSPNRSKIRLMSSTARRLPHHPFDSPSLINSSLNDKTNKQWIEKEKKPALFIPTWLLYFHLFVFLPVAKQWDIWINGWQSV